MAKNKSITIESYISPLTSTARSNGESTLGSVLSRVRSSHEPVFIYNDADEFLGLISPFETLFSGNYPYTTKVSSIAFKPPLITKETPLYQVAKHMLAAKIYALPVFSDEGDIERVVYVKDILKEVATNSSLLKFVSDIVRPHVPITARATALVKEIFNELKERNVSRMILTDAEGALAGIATRSDLMQAMIKPTDKFRFPKEGSGPGRRSLAGEKKPRKTEPVTRYYTARVDTLPDRTPTAEIVKRLIISSPGSIVLTDVSNKPTGFLSTRDILEALAKLRPEETARLMIKKPSDAVSDKQLEEAADHLGLFAKKLGKRMGIEKIEVTSREPKNTAGKTKKFALKLVVTPVAGDSLVAETKERQYIAGVRKATELIRKQHHRSGLSKEETKKSRK